MMRRARSVSRLRCTTPGREATPSIYELGSVNDGTGVGGFSTRLSVYAPDVYGSISRLTRAASVARFKDIDEEILGNGSISPSRTARALVSNRFDHLRARRPYSAYGTHDFDYFDRYTERIRDRTPIAVDTHYTHFRPYYWYHTAPRTIYYDFPHDDWRYRPLSDHRSSMGSDSSYAYRFNDSIDRVGSLKRAMRDLDYTRELRQLRYATPTTYSTITHGDNLLSRARDEVRRAVDARVGGRGLSRTNNIHNYFGRAYAELEDGNVTDVALKYTELGQLVQAKPSNWKVEDTLDLAYALQVMNDQTADKIAENKKKVLNHRNKLVENNHGVAHRLSAFDKASKNTHRDVSNALRSIQNLKEMKTEVFKRLST